MIWVTALSTSSALDFVEPLGQLLRRKRQRTNPEPAISQVRKQLPVFHVRHHGVGAGWGLDWKSDWRFLDWKRIGRRQRRLRYPLADERARRRVGHGIGANLVGLWRQDGDQMLPIGDVWKPPLDHHEEQQAVHRQGDDDSNPGKLRPARQQHRSPKTYLTGFLSTPTPGISTSTTSPGFIGAVPAGVPVAIRSPGLDAS